MLWNVNGTQLTTVLRGIDMAMKATLNGKERDADQWRQLFKSAGPGFHLLSIRTPSAGRFSVIEAEWVGERARL